jgi:hypothetical protein
MASNSRLDEILGKDPQTWPIFCLVQYPTNFDAEIDKFVSAVEFAVQGSITESKKLLSTIQSQVLADYFIEVGQNAGAYRMKGLGRNTSKQHSGKQLKWPKSREFEVLIRDSFRCRYCQIRLMHEKQLDAFEKLVGNEVFPNGDTNRSRHGIRLIMRASFDHVVPVSHDSDEDKNVLENVVASCWSCNFGKSYFTIEELGLEPPPERLFQDGWDGLTTILKN